MWCCQLIFKLSYCILFRHMPLSRCMEYRDILVFLLSEIGCSNHLIPTGFRLVFISIVWMYQNFLLKYDKCYSHTFVLYNTSHDVYNRFVFVVLSLFDSSQFYPHSPGLLRRHWGNHNTAPMPMKQRRMWANMNCKRFYMPTGPKTLVGYKPPNSYQG